MVPVHPFARVALMRLERVDGLESGGIAARQPTEPSWPRSGKHSGQALRKASREAGLYARSETRTPRSDAISVRSGSGWWTDVPGGSSSALSAHPGPVDLSPAHTDLSRPGLRTVWPQATRARPSRTFPSAVRNDRARLLGPEHVDVEFGIQSLHPLQPGRVKEVLVHDAARVKSGKELLRLDDRQARHRLKEAEAAVKAATAQCAQARLGKETHAARSEQPLPLRPPSALGRLFYLASVCLGYTAMLLAIHFHQLLLTVAIALSLSLFHATEYLAVVSWSVRMKHGRNGHGVFRHLVPRWGLALAMFIGVLAISGWLADTHYHNLWAVVTIAVSYLHYAYDGIIWKVRRKA